MDLWWLCSPCAMVVLCVLVFLPLRLTFGGGNYLPSKSWYLLCFIIPGFVVVALLPGAFCVPIWPDVATFIHLGLVLIYVQIDLCVARRLSGPTFGAWFLCRLLPSKLRLCGANLDDDGLTPSFIPPLGRSLFELNGALFHEIFWNVLICQNCIDYGVPVPLAILAVPAVSCLVHGITSNFNQGLRCFPNFVWVALSYHASGSVLVPGFIHAMWYFVDGKLCFSLKTIKRDWDKKERAAESETPAWDLTCSVGMALILTFYVPLNVLAEYFPALRSARGLQHAAACQRGELPTHFVEWVLVVGGVVQIIAGAATWGHVRAGMIVLERTGNLTEDGIVAIKAAVAEYAHRCTLFGIRRRQLSSLSRPLVLAPLV